MRERAVNGRRAFVLLLAGGVLVVAGSLHSMARAETGLRDPEGMDLYLELHGEVARAGSLPARRVEPERAPACMRSAEQPATDPPQDARG